MDRRASPASSLFRLFDVIKPYPANRLEQLHGGIGVMADDAMAAVYANLALRAALHWVMDNVVSGNLRNRLHRLSNHPIYPITAIMKPASWRSAARC